MKAAQTWDLVKPQAWLHTETVQIRGGKTHSGRDDDYIYEGGERIASHGFESVMTITKEMLDSNNLESLEHIDIRVWISHSRRGDVEVELVSPNEITSVLARKRRLDDAQTGFPGWRFMTVKHWCAYIRQCKRKIILIHKVIQGRESCGRLGTESLRPE